MKSKIINSCLLTVLCILSKNVLSMEENIDIHTRAVDSHNYEPDAPVIAFERQTTLPNEARILRCPFGDGHTALVAIKTRNREFNCPRCSIKKTSTSDIALIECPECANHAIGIKIDESTVNIQCNSCGLDDEYTINQSQETVETSVPGPISTPTNYLEDEILLPDTIPNPKKSIARPATLGAGLISAIGVTGYGIYRFLKSDKPKLINLRASAYNKISALKERLNKHYREIAVGSGIGLSLFAILTLPKANLAAKIKDTVLPFLYKSQFIETRARTIESFIPNNKIINAGLSMAGGALSAATYKLLRTRINKRTTQT